MLVSCDHVIHSRIQSAGPLQAQVEVPKRSHVEGLAILLSRRGERQSVMRRGTFQTLWTACSWRANLRSDGSNNSCRTGIFPCWLQSSVVPHLRATIICPNDWTKWDNIQVCGLGKLSSNMDEWQWHLLHLEVDVQGLFPQVSLWSCESYHGPLFWK